MIEYVQLRNFQSHKDTELEFSPGVNVLIGESDHGKSAIMRAFYWAIFGKPAGDSMRRHGTKHDTEVTIETAEHQISRIRGNTTNQYIINDEVLKGFGQNVPQPIMDALNINEINFMRQLDPPFLFSKTAGEVAQYLNRLINLDVIDTSLSNIKRMHSQAEQQANGHLAEVERIQKALEKFEWIDSAETKVQELEKKERHINRLKNAAEELDDFLERAHNQRQIMSKLSYVKTISKEADRIEKLHKKIGLMVLDFTELRDVVSLVKTAKNACNTVPNTKGAEKAILGIEKLVVKCDALAAKYTTLKQAIKDVRKSKSILQEAAAEHKRHVLHLQKVMPNVCPLCDQEINPEDS